MGSRHHRRFSRLLLLVLALALPAIEPYTPFVFAGHQGVFFSSNAQGGFEPTGIDFGFRLNVPNTFNEPRMLVTRPWDGNPRQLVQQDADASIFRLRATLPNRSPNNVKFVDSVAAIPAVVGTQAAQTTDGGFTPNDILVTQGFNVYLISGAGTVPPAVAPVLLAPSGETRTIPASTQCTSTNTDVLVDRYALQFGGAAIVTCFSTGVTPVFEVWTITKVGNAVTTALHKRLSGQITGRATLTSPNFGKSTAFACGGCLAVSPDDTAEVILIPGSGTPLSVPLGSAATGRRLAITVPTRPHDFPSSNLNTGCLFGTVPAQNAIKAFACPNDTLFGDSEAPTNAGDLLIFTSAGVVLRVAASKPSDVAEVHSGASGFEDLAFASLRLVEILVQQPAASNPNKGVEGSGGNIVFYIESAPGFAPQADVNISTLRFGRFGNEMSVTSCNTSVGTDVNTPPDGVPDLKCFADPAIANCGGVVLCIVTGFTYNQVGFDGGW